MTNANRKTTFKDIIIVITGVIGVICLLFLFFGSDGILLTNNGIQSINNSNFELLENSSSISEDGTYTITGKVKQKENKNFDGIFITFTMYDNNNNEVRSTSMNLSNYLGNGIWEFSAIGNDADKVVTSYKLKSIYGY